MRRALGLLVAGLCAATSAGARVPESLPGAPPFSPELRVRLERELASRGAGYVPRTSQRTASGAPRYTNRLLLEASPYLQQHAHNPVNWHPWGPEAFATARRLDRPVLVSIGYSTCHWCHVMEEESFDDPAIARMLNADFVAIKVDREVRPAIDAVYMSAAHALVGRGGWPLNVWTTPEGEPFFAGTYFPPVSRPGRPGLTEILEQLRRRWAERRPGLERTARRLTKAVRRDLEGVRVDASLEVGSAPLHAAYERYRRGFDPEWGGLGRGIKFPSSLPVRFLLRYHRRTGNPKALEMVTLTLDRMESGGIHDPVGGGFHRYATERRWLVPHFEKMLYDNALRVVDYLEAWQVTGRPAYARVVRETLDYLLREMRSPQGGFYSATDADSLDPAGELEEGAYFTWTPAEIDAALPADQAAAARAFWGVTEAGQLDGRSVLHAWRSPEEVAAALGIEPAALARRLEAARLGLRRARALRPAPLRDEKILTAWNGLAISALARAGFALDEPRYVSAAARAADLLLTRGLPAGRLRRVIGAAGAHGQAFLSDYAYSVAGLLDLYEASGDARWLRGAVALQAVVDAHYADPEGGAYYGSADEAERLITREKPGGGGSIPSPNSVTASNLLRLAELTGDTPYSEHAVLLFAALAPDLLRTPTALPDMLMALDYRLDQAKEIVIVEPAAGDGGVAELLTPLRGAFVPNRVVARVEDGVERDALAALVPLVRGRRALGGRATAYVCLDRVCRLPTSDPAVFAEQLGVVAPLD